MPSFEIPDGPTTVKLAGSVTDAAAPRTGSIVFTVNNKSGEGRAARLSVQVAGQSKADWFVIDGEAQRNIAAGASETVTVNISVPASESAGDYPFRLRVVAVNDPDNDFADGPATTAHADKTGGGGGGGKAWIWIVVAVLVLLVIGGITAWLLMPPDEPDVAPTETPTETAAPTTATVPDLVGKTVAEAQPLAKDFDFTPVPGTADGKVPSTIVSQAPNAGTTQPIGNPLKVTFDPGVVVPSLIGFNTDTAVNKLNSVGLHVQSSTTRCESSGTAGLILDQDPKADQTVAKNSGVKVVVRAVDGRIGTRILPCGRPFIIRRLDQSVLPVINR